MTSPFSWSDTVKIAFVSCLPCLKPGSDDHSEHEDQPHNPAINRIPRARPDELQGLLADTDTDMDAETLSLHSNPGRARRKKKKKRTKNHNNPRRITFFGYDLFGRPPVQLLDEDDALYYRRNGDMTPNTIVTAHSTATFDSDAAPLDSDTIAALSSSNVAPAAQASVEMEAQRLKEKEERRQRRREKKELKRLAESMEAPGDGEDFEGFQGSGGFMAPPLRKGYSHILNATSPASDSGSGSAFSGSAQEEYGRFVAAQAPSIPQPEDDHDNADLDGGVYAHKRRRDKGSHGGSDSRSRTSTSTSDRGLHQAPLKNGHAQIQAASLQPQPGRRKKSSRTSVTTDSSTISQSPSLPSPISPTFSNGIVSPSTVEQGQGLFDAEDSVGPSIPNDVKKPVGEFSTPRLRGGEFPMTGFRGLTSVGVKRTGDLGAFLARRGDEDETNRL
ncbi:hypothetical protein BYT27DRAFT_7181169 [Phlegmacium glaucopus]|nr:hypothetical protein BYT27DRAFT_7181169 [Phlegmacium glaucopus]